MKPRAPRVGTTAFRIVNTMLYRGSLTHCLCCERPFTIRQAAIAFTAGPLGGTEVVGYICPACVNDEARQRLAQVLREVADV